MSRSFVFFLLAILAAPVPAAVYKCQDASGGTSYQQNPCPGTGSEAQIRPQPPSKEEEDTARLRGQRDMKAAEELERQYETRRREAWRQEEERRAARHVASTRCSKYLEDAERLTRAPGKARQQQRNDSKAEELRKRHFTECYSAGR